MEFKSFTKIARLSRDIVITEKIDGTNGIIAIGENGEFQIGSRNKWLTTETGEVTSDNAGFARWAIEHRDDLMKLGTGFHYGEWWGKGIQRGYGLSGKCFSLFNVAKWRDANVRPACCGVVPTLYEGPFTLTAVDDALNLLRANGSLASPGFPDPEGIVIFHTASGTLFKKTIKNDEQPKSLVTA